jgi:hypothetical protein
MDDEKIKAAMKALNEAPVPRKSRWMWDGERSIQVTDEYGRPIAAPRDIIEQTKPRSAKDNDVRP